MAFFVKTALVKRKQADYIAPRTSPTRSGRERSSRNESLLGQDPVFHFIP